MKSEQEAEHQKAKRHNYGKIAIACLPTFVSQDSYQHVSLYMEERNVCEEFGEGHDWIVCCVEEDG